MCLQKTVFCLAQIIVNVVDFHFPRYDCATYLNLQKNF